MTNNKPGLFGINHSNRDFTNKNTWGKNQFNSSFPAALSAYLYERNFDNVYLTLDKDLKVVHNKISTLDFFGLDPNSDDLFYSFESAFTPYEQLLVGHLPRVDLVTQSRSSGQALKPIEIKLTALPDNTTCSLTEDNYGTEIVVRPDTIVYLACSIVNNFKDRLDELKSHFPKDFEKIEDWTEGTSVWPYLPQMLQIIDEITLSILDKQEPILMQPIWKTLGKSPALSENCLDVFVWSNFAFTQLFLDVARGELSSRNRITRQIRTIIWLFKMIYDFSNNGQFNHAKIIDSLSYNTKNDKAFAVSGLVTFQYMRCEELTKPRITKDEIKNIILGGGQNLLSPERRFDAIIFNSPEIFE
ncbi:putative type-2 restriction enzyme HindVP [Patiriisocius marinistellae]|uniref:Putative type-2 restriction enzyme HindVP n=1 Tax=Patiriisocius marinistellae TaxID=2494560 RepID=A0A5J4G392_9FLAO|nr:HindVP family restriction endonuclease [Patiriisocius marinistellae]GEQ87409.1 putative type-2 restriction enzyme HindVP [Patiriisocius marinistellae]